MNCGAYPNQHSRPSQRAIRLPILMDKVALVVLNWY